MYSNPLLSQCKLSNINIYTIAFTVSFSVLGPNVVESCNQKVKQLVAIGFNEVSVSHLLLNRSYKSMQIVQYMFVDVHCTCITQLHMHERFSIMPDFFSISESLSTKLDYFFSFFCHISILF